MSLWLKQSTAVTVKIGPFVDDTDFKTAETALTISQADIRLSKNGGAFAQSNNVAGATHDASGYYGVPLDTTDTNTLGTLRVFVAETGALQVWQDFMVVPANVWDSLFGADKLQVHADEITSGLITRAALAADTGLQTIRSGTAQAGAAGSITLDAGASSTAEFYRHCIVLLTGGTGAGQSRIITNYNGTTKVASIAIAWAVNPDATTTFAIFPGNADVNTWNGEAPSNLSGGNVRSDIYNIQAGQITAAAIATGAIDADAIADNAIDRAALAADTGLQTIRSGTAQAGGATTITLDAGASAIHDFYEHDIIVLTGGTGVGQARVCIGSNGTSKVADIAKAWVTNPDATTTFAILPAGADVQTWRGDSPAAIDGGGRVSANVTNIGIDTINAASIAADAVTEIQSGLSTLTAAQVNAEVVDALNVDTYAEPGQEVPPATTTLVKKLGYLYKFLRNKITQDTTTLKVFADDAATVDQKATVTDVAGTYTRGEIESGP